jgi:hypothetical protein
VHRRSSPRRARIVDYSAGNHHRPAAAFDRCRYRVTAGKPHQRRHRRRLGTNGTQHAPLFFVERVGNGCKILKFRVRIMGKKSSARGSTARGDAVSIGSAGGAVSGARGAAGDAAEFRQGCCGRGSSIALVAIPVECERCQATVGGVPRAVRKGEREQAEAIRRARKLARKKARREGLIAASRARKVPRGRPTGRGPFWVAGALSFPTP